MFNRPGGVRFRAVLGGGIDIKGDGYIVAPPSIHESGRAYVWEESSRPGEVPLADLPSWSLALAIDYTPVGGYGLAETDVTASFLARAFAHAGWLGRRIDDVRVAVRCPWQHEHSDGARGSASSTVLFAPNPGSTLGWFHCLHTGHGPKSPHDVVAALPLDAVLQATADASQAVADAAAALARPEPESGR